MSVSGYKVHTSQLAVLGGKLRPGPQRELHHAAADSHFRSRPALLVKN